MAYGYIFDIQKFAVHDGPGIRTTIFLKGCSNRCGWCHNPESFITGVQLQYFGSRCVNCMKCVDACPNGAHYVESMARDGIGDNVDRGNVDNGIGDNGVGDNNVIDNGLNDNVNHIFDRSKCDACGACAATCYAGALMMTGRRATVDEVMREVMADAPYYETSGGGVTLSGGEPVIQGEFALELLSELKAAGIHTNIQTAGYYPFERLKTLLPALDMVMYDIKGISGDIYKKHIGDGRERMLENLFLLDAEIDRAGRAPIPIIVRTPVIVGVNATSDEIESIARYIKPLKHLESYRLIPYHGLGRAKYDSLGAPYDNIYKTPDQEALKALEHVAAGFVPVFSYK